MSKVAKYRRQVSEDPDIDSLLSTLSPEEMEELEKELDVGDPDGSVPVGLRQRGPPARPCGGTCDPQAPLSLREEQPKKLVHRELPADVSARAGDPGQSPLCALSWRRPTLTPPRPRFLEQSGSEPCPPRCPTLAPLWR